VLPLWVDKAQDLYMDHVELLHTRMCPLRVIKVRKMCVYKTNTLPKYLS